MQVISRGFVRAGILILLAGANALPAQAVTFNNASLKGSYSFLTNLWTANTSTNQFAMVGVLTFDGAGNVTGSYTSIDGGVVQTGTLGGTYTVNSNGTGTITLTTGSTAQFAVTLDSTAAGVAHGVQLLQTNDSNNEIISGTAVLQSTTAQTYSVASLKGNFSAQLNLWTADVKQVEDSGVSINTLDGKGNYKFTETDVLGGKLETETSTGTYTVNTDGSFSLLTASGGKAACVLNTVTAGQAKGAQCLVTALNGKSLGNIDITGIALKQ